MTINVSAHIESDLAKKLEQISKFEGRSKTYYIKEGLARILDEKFQDMQDMIKAKETLKNAKKTDGFVSFDEVFKDIK